MMIPEELLFGNNDSISDLAMKLEPFVRNAATEGQSLHDVEQKVLGRSFCAYCRRRGGGPFSR